MDTFRQPVPVGDQRARRRRRGGRRLPGAAPAGSSDDDLPRFEAEFKTYLNTNTIREIAQFQAKLNRQSDADRERDRHDQRVAGRHRLQPGPLHPAGAGADAEHRDPGLPRRPAGLHRRRGLGARATTSTPSRSSCRSSGSSSGSTAGRGTPTRTERGRGGSPTCATGSPSPRPNATATTTPSTSTTRLRRQVRRSEGEARLHRSSPPRWPTSSGWSGAPRSRGRSGSWSSTRRSAEARTNPPGSRCELFGELGLQLLIVTPLQKIHVIEPYVAAVGFVDNPTGSYSRLQTLTIEEYHQQQIAHALGAQPSVAAAVA